ncbi:DUF4369 domain-containing protein [Prevotella sp.]|uniref:DUF4369 domain-containing protein n=1 Tax=Prevotella sp. TaxID=59823 RepID=UPI0027E23650|nr:DUF4369 domain-containing protein [Prevotella sp.]
MKKYSLVSLLSFLTLLLASCGTDSHHFKIDGHLLNLNQGEFYVYSPDGSVTHGMDTIKVQAGRFSYLVECDRPMTLMIVFPNFTEQPVFAEPGKSVDIKGNASHLKELTVKGTKANKLINAFREQILSASPAEIKKCAIQMAEDNPESAVAVYLVRRYLVTVDRPDYTTAARLLKLIVEKQPDNQFAARLLASCNGKTTINNGSLPRFSANDINGKVVNNATLASVPNVVFYVWATWNYSSTSQLRQLADMERQSDGKLKVVSICLNPDKNSCQRTLKQYGADNITTICDGRMVNGDLFNKLGLYNLPDNILIKNGAIAEQHIEFSRLIGML